MEAKYLRRALRVIKEVRKHDPELQTQAAQVFLEIALDQGLSVSDVAERLGIGLSSASRNVSLLSKTHRSGRPGLDWVKSEQSPDEPRKKKITLTPKGRLVAESIGDIIKGD